MWSPSAKASIALASVDAAYGEIGEGLTVEIYYQRELKWSRVMATATVVKDPFYNPPRKRMTPAPDF
jgi:aminomethyltransferase